MLRLTTDDAKTWSRIGEHEVFVSDVVDQATACDAKMTVGFARVGKRSPTSMSWTIATLQRYVS